MFLPNNLLIFLLIIISAFHSAKGQALLTLESAIKEALSNNYDIRIAENNASISRNNYTLANAGVLPLVTGDYSNNNSIQDSRQVRSTGDVTERENARSSNLNYGVNLRWTVFDGLSMFSRYQQLKALQNVSEETQRLTVLNTVNNVYILYYSLVNLQQQLNALKTTLEISRFRIDVAQARFQLGKAAKLEVLNTKVDFNTDTTSWLRLTEQYQNTQTRLNEIIARPLDIRFKVSDSLLINTGLSLDTLQAWSSQSNPEIKISELQSRIASLELRRIRGRRLPTVNLGSGYNFTKSESALGFATQTTGQGLTYSVTASVNIFNGFLQNRTESIAKLQIKNAEVNKEKLIQNVNAELRSAFQTYTTNLALVQLEQTNVEIAKQNLDITLEKFRLGSISTVEMRQAQLNFSNAQVRFSDAQFQAKQAEIALRLITGKFVF